MKENHSRCVSCTSPHVGWNLSRALLMRQIVHILPGRRSRNRVKGGTRLILFFMSPAGSWIFLVSPPPIHEGLFFCLSPLSPERPWASLSKSTSSQVFRDWTQKGSSRELSFSSPALSWKQPTSLPCMLQNSAAPGHWALQKCLPQWLHILSHSNPVIFQMTWGFESKWSSETASAAKFFLDSFGNDKTCHIP